MTDVPASETVPPATEVAAAPAKKEDSFGWFLVKLVLAVLVFRTFLFTSFMIPSESMMPRLLEGDYLFAAKWPMGYSRASLPGDLAIAPPGRLFGRLPTRGDVLIFKHPVDRVDYVKRVIGLPGDRIAVVAGQVVLNGTPIPKRKIADFVLPIRPGQGCALVQFAEPEGNGASVCRYSRFHETLPNGVGYDVLDFGPTPQDDFATITVPAGQLFMMGDNRDNSLDSRFPARSGQGVGLVPVDNVAGRASFMFFSTDGTAEWLKPWTWFTAARWNRIGHAI